MTESKSLILGTHETNTLAQLADVATRAAHTALMADAHLGYIMPIGGVAAYHNAVSVVGVGFDIACVDAETEFLSPGGWIRIDQWQGQKICQFDPNTNEASFVAPDQYLRLPATEPFFWLKSQHGIDHMVSGNHRLLLYRGEKFERPFETTAAQFVVQHDRAVQGASYKFNTAFQVSTESHLELSEHDLRAQIMVCADGCFPTPTARCVLSFKKNRKIERARALLRAAHIEYGEKGPDVRGYTIFRFTAPIKTKTLSGFWAADAHQLKIIAEEVLYWDGSMKHKTYYSRDKASADFIHYAFAATGSRSVFRGDAKDGKIDYRVFSYANPKCGLKTVKRNGKVPVLRVPSSDGYQYCFKVPSGFFVTRRGGNIIMTGNCGNCAIMTDLHAGDFPAPLLAEIADEIHSEISFGVGRKNRSDDAPIDDPLFESAVWQAVPAHARESLRDKARAQLGTVGSGNHYIDVFVDTLGRIWVGAHFGSRGLGHTIASGFLALHQGTQWGARVPEQEALLDLASPMGDAYFTLMELAGRYAYAGREWVARKVVSLLGGRALDMVHNHHNYAWRETHFGEEFIVVRKGATPAFPGQRGFVGGSMGDDSVILRGTAISPNSDPDLAETQRSAMFSTVHGAGRVMSRTEAAGKVKRGKIWSCGQRDCHGTLPISTPLGAGGASLRCPICQSKMHRRETRETVRAGKVSPAMMADWVAEKSVILRGGGLDESPHAYRRLPEVLAAQGGTIEVLETLRPLIVVMAGADEFDPYKD